jgi:hypothetical protein
VSPTLATSTGRRAALHTLLDRLLDARPEVDTHIEHALRVLAGEFTRLEAESLVNVLRGSRAVLGFMRGHQQED